MREFCARWRLELLLGPFLPQPLQPQFPAALPGSAARHAQSGGSVIFVPDTGVLPSRGEVQRQIEEAIRGGERPGHLADWYDIASSENTGKQSIGRYSRLFELQHYCRILFQRHPRALHRKQVHLKGALAEFLDVNEDSIHKDWIWQSKQLGKTWYLAGDPLIRS